jgi:glycosyltransferase involved in cell wall biosynthesis
MRVALVGPAHPYKGGGARHTTELAHRLAAEGHDVIVESWRAQYPARLYPGQQTVDEPEGEPYPRTFRRLSWRRPDGWLAAGRRLRTADLVVFALLTPIQVPAYLAILAGLGRKTRRPRTVVICHNVLPHEHRPGDKLLTRVLLRQVGAALVHSAEQADLARTLAPAAEIAVAQMPPHLPVAKPQAVENSQRAKAVEDSGGAEGVTAAVEGAPCRLLFFGIVRPYKGLDVLLRALARVPPHVTLTVAGEFWGGTAATEGLIGELGITGRVTLRPGYVPASEIPELFGAADALVLPYRSATASQNTLLAFAYGVPVIATTAGSLADQVRDGVNGLTCVPGDVDDLVRALERISWPGTVTTFRSGIRSFDPEPCWGDYLQVLLSGGRSRSRSRPTRGRRRSWRRGRRARRLGRTRTA